MGYDTDGCLVCQEGVLDSVSRLTAVQYLTLRGKSDIEHMYA